MAKSVIPVLLLTGYLGSGKTTLLNRILANKKGIKFAVIVNDIGEINIDASLIQQGGVVNEKDSSLVPLQNGCICCTLKMDLIQQLCELADAKKFDYIVIEASGICEPVPIAQSICSIPQLGGPYVGDVIPALDCIVSVVDALRLRDEFDTGSCLLRKDVGEDDIESLITQQIEFCNIILLNKASEISKDELGKVTKIVRTIQPEAEIIPTDFCDVDLDKLINTYKFDFNKVAQSAAWIKEVEEHKDDDLVENELESEEELEYGIGTFVWYRRDPMDINKFDAFVSKWPRNIIRCKGMCYFKGEEKICYLFEQSGKQFLMKGAGQWFATMPPEELRRQLESDEQLKKDWDPKYGDRMQKLVFIGQNIDKEALTKALDFCLVKDV